MPISIDPKTGAISYKTAPQPSDAAYVGALSYDPNTNSMNSYAGNNTWETRDLGTPAPAPVAAGGSGTDNTDAQDLAYLDDQEGQARRLLESAAKTRANGITQIGDTYNKSVSRADQAKAAAVAGYTTNREDTTRGKMSAIGSVNTGARTLADSVRRLLGLASGSNSTAFRETAPNAIARDASIKRTGVNETYGKNFRDIDTSEAATLSSFQQHLEDLADEKKQKEQGLEEGILQQEQGVYSDLGDIARQRAIIKGGGYNAVRSATAGARTAITDRQATLDSLFEKYRTPFASKDATVQAPKLSDYTVDRTAINVGENGGDQNSPYASFLKKKFQTA